LHNCTTAQFFSPDCAGYQHSVFKEHYGPALFKKRLFYLLQTGRLYEAIISFAFFNLLQTGRLYEAISRLSFKTSRHFSDFKDFKTPMQAPTEKK